MKRLSIFVRLIAISGGAIGVVLSNGATSWLKPFGFPGWFPNLIALLIVAASTELLKEGADFAVSASQPLRRILLRRQFIEGSWLDIAYKDGEPYSIGIIRIEPEGTSIRVSGELFDLQGEPKGIFRSEMTNVQWPVLRYKYSAVRSSISQRDDFQGYTELQFAERDGIPLRFQGYYCDFLQGDRCDVRAMRLQNEEELKQLLDTGALCGNVILSIAQRCELTGFSLPGKSIGEIRGQLKTPSSEETGS